MITTLLPAPIGAIEVFGVDVARHKLAVRRLIRLWPCSVGWFADLISCAIQLLYLSWC